MLTPEQEKRIMEIAVSAYGYLQFNMLSEECGELLSAANKYIRNRADADAFIEEIVDVQIMCEQMLLMVGGTKERVETMRQEKLERLRKRLLDNSDSYRVKVLAQNALKGDAWDALG